MELEFSQVLPRLRQALGLVHLAVWGPERDTRVTKFAKLVAKTSSQRAGNTGSPAQGV